MPELPEVETVRSQVAPHVEGRTITAAWARLERITKPSVGQLVEGTTGRRITAARRHGKQLYFVLDDASCLLVHLGMSGRLAVYHAAPPEPLPRHVHGVFALGQAWLVFTDPRTFGELRWEPDESFCAHLGQEPLAASFDPRAVVQAWRGRRVKLKAALLDQRVVAGVGNIYADEICWQARVHPEQRLCDLAARKLLEVAELIAPVLRRGVEARGATLRDGGYQDLFGVEGDYLPDAYGRTGEPCNRCSTPLVRGTLGSGKSARSYHCCPRCQRLRG
jgi:formamidopyrimidine-DNA glycosylase